MLILSPVSPSTDSLLSDEGFEFVLLLDAFGASCLESELRGFSKAEHGCSSDPGSCEGARGLVTARLERVSIGLLRGLVPLLLLFLAPVPAACEQCALCACFPFGAQPCKTFLICDLQWFWLGLKLLASKTQQG